MTKAKVEPRHDLEAQMHERGMTQRDLARKLGVSEGTVSRWISGERLPGMVAADKIRHFFAIPVSCWVAEKKRRNAIKEAA